MRKLLILVVVVATAWSGYWFVGARALKSEISAWLDARHTEGWQVEYDDLSLRGFPNRFDTTLSNLQLTDPETGVSWSAPFFQLLALSYKPHHVIAVWPGTQQIATPEQKIDIVSDKATASIVVSPNNHLTLERATIVLARVNATSSHGWSAGFEDMTAAIRQSEGNPDSYDIATEIKTLTPDDGLRAILDRGGSLPDQIERVRLDMEVRFSSPLDRRTIEEARPDVTAITLNDVRGTWGELQLRATGSVDVDGEGRMSGDVTINAKQWREMLRMATDAGAISPEAAATAEFGLNFLASNSDALEVDLALRAGRMFVGPIPLGDAPRIILR